MRMIASGLQEYVIGSSDRLVSLAARCARQACGSVLGTILLAILLGVSMPVAANAQAVWGTINGYAKDSSGAVIPGAVATATNVKTGVTTQTKTDPSGFYNLTHLNPGEYSLSVESSGFQRFVRKPIVLEVGATVRVNATLAVGSVKQAVTVTGAPPILKSEKTEVSMSLNERDLQTLPASQNNVTTLYSLVPGALKDPNRGGPAENPQGGNKVFVNGMWQGSNTYLLDGIADTDYGYSGYQLIVPPPDAIQEVKMTTADYDPEIGDTAALVAQYVTRSGTNRVHGSVYAYNQNSALFAADPFTEKIAGTGPEGKGTGVAPYNYNQGGFSLGGPIKKNKIFFFGDFQFTRQASAYQAITTVPNAAFRNGDFSAYPNNPIFNPSTGNPSDGTGRTQFTNNIIDPSLISPVAKNLLALLPMPNINQSTDNNYVGTSSVHFNTYQFDNRVDWNVGEKNRLFARYSYFKTSLNSPGLFGVVAGGPSPSPGYPAISNTLSQQAAANYTRTISPNMIMELRAGFVRFHLDTLPPDSGLNTNTQVGIPNINTGIPLTGGLSNIEVNGPLGTFNMGDGSGGGQRFEGSTTEEYVANWTLIKGAHQFEWGADIQRQQFNFLAANYAANGVFIFQPSLTSSPSVAGSGLGMASFLLGFPSEFRRAVVTSSPGERQTRIGLYGQDVWHVTTKFTASLGLRWDYFSPLTPSHPGGVANFDPATGNILLGGLGNVSDSANITTPKDDFSPRVGLAYRLTRRTVIRAGVGRSFFSSGYGATFGDEDNMYPIINNQDVLSSSQYTSVFPIEQGPPAPTVPTIPSSGILPAPNGTQLYTRGPEWKTENVYSWNFTIQHQIGANSTISVRYLGSSASHIYYNYNINAAPPGVGPLVDRRPYYNLYGLTQTINSVNNDSNQNYNALIISGDKRFSKYYSLTSNLSWSKALGYRVINQVNRSVNYGVGQTTTGAGIDRALVWNLGYNISLPYGPGLRFGSNAAGLKKALFAGWQTSGIWTAESGLATRVGLANSSSFNADFGNVPDRVPGAPLYPQHQTFSNWLNPAAFTAPPPLQYGDAAPGMLRGPGVFEADLALWKSWKFNSFLNRSEGTDLQLRWEVFNAFNNTNAAQPNTNVGSPAFGDITSLQGGFYPREMQIGIHLSW